jgi:hypothetical protein
VTLKEKMERVWATNKVACPSHLCRWNENGRGWSFGFAVFLGYVDYLWFLPGKKTFPGYFHINRFTSRSPKIDHYQTKKDLLRQHGVWRRRPW